MSEEKNMEKMTSVLVSCGNLERIKAIGKKGKTFDDVVTKLLDYYEDIQREDWVNIRSDETRCKEQIKDKRWLYTTLCCLSEVAD
jgi:hypothetical protein